jgi:hypothetical protein
MSWTSSVWRPRPPVSPGARTPAAAAPTTGTAR